MVSWRERLAYRALILILGLTMVSTMIYSLVSFPNTSVSMSMLQHPAYLAVLTACILGHTSIWFLCLYAKSDFDTEAAAWGYSVLALQTVGWVGLVTNLQGTVHVVFVFIFATSYTIIILILCYLVWQHTPAVILRIGLIIALFSDTLMLILYDSPDFYLPEHVNLIGYALFFTVFFATHTYDEWGLNQRPYDDEPFDCAPLLAALH